VRASRCVVLLLACGLALGDAWALAAPPEQFRVWGSAGPELPPPPDGWTEVRAAPDGLSAIAPTPEEQRRGYILFARDPLAPVSPCSIPFPSERVSELRAFAARGEYEPVSLCIHALEPLKDVAVAAGELRSGKDDLIPTDHIDVRVVRALRVPVDAKAKTYRLEPFLLERRAAFPVAKGATAQVWLTLRVPETAQGGRYEGKVSVRLAGREATELKLALEVLPFALPPAPVELAMFYPRPAADDAMLLKELTDMREHGLNAFETPVGVEVKSRDQTFGDDDIAATRARSRRMMAAATKVFGQWRFPLNFDVGHQIAYYWDKDKNWFVHWPHSKKIDDDFCKAIDVVREEAKAGGWPPLRAYALDEAGAHNLLDEAVHYYGLIKKRYPDMETWTDIGGGIAMGHDEIGKLAPVIDFFSTNRFTPEIARALLDHKRPYGVYNGAGHTLAGPRYFFGFYGFKTGAAQIAQWVYRFGDGGLKGFRQDDEGYAYAAPDGPLPSLAWESVREGVDDYRYVHLLRQWLAAAAASDKAEDKKAVADAGQALTSILGRMGWGFQALASSERTPPPHPSTLRKWRWAVASRIAAIERIVARLPGQDPVEVLRVSPLDLPWPTPEPEETSYGQELLPPSGFEAEMKPWRVEAWNGKGKGELDANERHAGKQSVRIEVPTGTGSQAVTVLVWPSWGGGGLKLRLEGARIYELSAWVKCKGRSVPPSPRIALPAGAARSTREGKDTPDPNGWQRVWTRCQMAFPAEPKYLAVWVQGEGIVWADDLSLREVIPAPLELSLDQAEYDGADKVGIATASVAEGVAPAQVRFTLARAGGEAVAQLVAPFQAQARLLSAPQGQAGEAILVVPATMRRSLFVFDPAGLAPGRYEVKAELLDARGAATAARSAQLSRNAGH